MAAADMPVYADETLRAMRLALLEQNDVLRDLRDVLRDLRDELAHLREERKNEP